MFKQKNKRSMVGMVIIILVMLTVTAGLIKTTMEKRVLDTKVEELEATKKDLTEKQKKLEEDTQKLSEEVDLKEQELKDEKERLKKEKGNVKKQKEQIQQKEEEINRLKKRLNQANTQASAPKSSVKKGAQVNNVSTNNNKNSSGKVKARHTMNATHYSAFCPTGCTGKTADGTDVSNTIAPNGMRVVAVDPNVIPLGTKVRVTGHGHDFIAIARDTGGDIKGNRIDILVGSTKEAYALGRGNVTVEIID